MGILAGLLLGLLLAFMRDFMDDRIKSEDDINTAEDYAVLGRIPHMSKIDDMAVLNAPKSGLAEAFRNLRTNLQFMVPAGTAHTIAVTSTISGEGKTTICINLGSIMSMADKKTIILNLDMRKPTLHSRFNLPNKKGMSTLLSGHAPLNDVIQKTKQENLDIISSGPVPPNPSELIQSSIIQETLEKLRESYDVIILDTPPVGLVTDARTLMHYADTNIYVLRSDYSKKDFLKNIKRLSTFEHIKSLGILLNDVKMDKNGCGYGYGYGYGYYEEDKK
jgi:capsular exopolysaccharide synthesis family protein